jgi:hypothetical protein
MKAARRWARRAPRRAGILLAPALLLLPPLGCWESVALGGGDTADGDGGTDEGTDSLVGWSCSDLSPCIQSVSSGFSCPGFASGVRCWDLGSACDADYLCASTGQACEIACAATTCGQSAAVPPHPVCAN